jgi:hypothetical protein
MDSAYILQVVHQQGAGTFHIIDFIESCIYYVKFPEDGTKNVVPFSNFSKVGLAMALGTG